MTLQIELWWIQTGVKPSTFVTYREELESTMKVLWGVDFAKRENCNSSTCCRPFTKWLFLKMRNHNQPNRIVLFVITFLSLWGRTSWSSWSVQFFHSHQWTNFGMNLFYKSWKSSFQYNSFIKCISSISQFRQRYHFAYSKKTTKEKVPCSFWIEKSDTQKTGIGLFFILITPLIEFGSSSSSVITRSEIKRQTPYHCKASWNLQEFP